LTVHQQALVALGGDATRKEIEAKLEGTIDGSLKEGDYAPNAHGVPRWKIMVGRARKPMISQGFITGENLLRWKITNKGEQVAKGGVKANSAPPLSPKIPRFSPALSPQVEALSGPPRVGRSYSRVDRAEQENIGLVVLR
jgi:hypothetical protein